MGVEPTRDRLTAPTGFEVRPPHQGRFSSKLGYGNGFGRFRQVCFDHMVEKVAAMRIDTTQVTPPNCHAMAIEKLKDLDRNLPANGSPTGCLETIPES